MYTVKFARAAIAAQRACAELESAINGQLGEIASIAVQGDAVYIETADEKQHTVLITDYLADLADGTSKAAGPQPGLTAPEKPKRKRRTKAEIAAEEGVVVPSEPVSAEDRVDNGNPTPAPESEDEPPFTREEPPVANWPATEPEPEPEPEPAEVETNLPGVNYYLQAEELEDGVWRLILYVEGTHPAVQGRFDSVSAALIAARPLREQFAADGWQEVRPIKAVNYAF